MLAVDFSVHQGRLYPAFWRCVKADGYDLAIVGSWHGVSGNPHAEANLLDALSEGLLVATYAVVGYGLSGSATVTQAKLFCGAAWDALLFCAIDVESGSPSLDNIRDAVDASFPNAKVIYTNRNAWKSITGDSHGFTDCGLWVADYDEDPAIGPVDFGGFPFAIAKQFDGTYQGHTPTVCSVACDKSTFYDPWIVAVQEPATPLPAPPAPPGGVVIDEQKLRENLDKEWAVRSRLNGEDGQEGLSARVRRFSQELYGLEHENYHQALEATANELDELVQRLFESVVGIKEATGLQ